MIPDPRVDAFASRLYEAYRTGTATSAGGIGHLSTADGYAVQRAVVAARRDDEGPVVGYKLGFTNERVQTEVGVDEPIYGHLLEDTVDVPTARAAEFVSPRVEPEIVVRLGDSLAATTDRERVADAVAGVAPAIEVVDTRTGSWTLTPGTAVADNALAARLVTGSERQLSECSPLPEVEVTISTDGTERTGRGAAVLGHPLDAVAWLSRAVDGDLPADTVVSTGSLTRTLPLRSGEPVTASFQPLGEVALRPA